MKKEAASTPESQAVDQDGELLPEYDFRGGVRGKYAAQFTDGTNIVRIDADLARVFRTAAEINRALRRLIAIGYDPASGE